MPGSPLEIPLVQPALWAEVHLDAKERRRQIFFREKLKNLKLEKRNFFSFWIFFFCLRGFRCGSRATIFLENYIRVQRDERRFRSDHHGLDLEDDTVFHYFGLTGCFRMFPKFFKFPFSFLFLGVL
jgi:hypothetical protein